MMARPRRGEVRSRATAVSRRHSDEDGRMAEPPTTLLSVRADARLEVPPDEAGLDCRVSAREDDKATALRVLAGRVDAAIAALSELGGVVRVASDERRPLVWLVRSTRSEPETRWDEKKHYVRTGKVIATGSLIVVVRDFGLLDRIGAALAGHEHVHVGYVGWTVDQDNPAWQQVRAAAIDAAIAKGLDYASALGGSLLRIEHVADLGLLGDRGGEYERSGVVENMAMAAGAPASDEGGGPSLDPVPQELHASIEARFTACVRPLA